MAIIQISKIQHRTGANVDLPQLSEGELGFATDEQKLYIGNDPLLHPPANNSTTTQVEILTEVSTLQYAKLEGSANTALNLADTYPGQLLVLAADGNTWVNAGGNILDASNTTVIPDYGLHLGDASNIKLTGGVNGYVLQTDGQGNLSWTSSGIIQYEITEISAATTAIVTTDVENLITTGVPITISGIGGSMGGFIQTAGENGTNKFYAIRLDNTTFELYKDTAFTTPVDSTGYTGTYDANSLVTVSFYSQGTGSPGGSNNQVQLNDGTGSFAGSANLTFSRITNQLTVGGNIAANIITANSVRGAVTGSIGATTPNTGAFTSITATTTAAIIGNVNAGNTNISGIANVVGNLNAGNIRTAGLANVGNLQVIANVTSNLLPNAHVTFNLGSSTQSWKDVFVGNSISINAQPITSDGTTATIVGNLTVDNADLGNVVTANYVTGTLTTASQPNITNIGTLSNLTVNGPVDLGNVGNLTIGGVTANYVLTVTEDGSGLNWLPTQQVITNPGGVDSQVQFNDNNIFGGNARLTFNKVSGLLTATSIAAEGGNVSNINASNVIGTVSSATIAGTVTTAAQPNITSVGTLTSVSVTGNANVGNLGTPGLIVAAGNVTGANLNTAGELSVIGNANVGNIGATIGVFTGNISSQNAGVSNLTTTNTLTVNTNATIGNISSVGNVTVTSNITAGNISTGGTLTVTGNAAAGNLNVGAVVAVGQISTTDNLVVTGNITSGNITTGRGTFSGNVSASNISASGNLAVSGNTSVSNVTISGNITGALLPSANVTYNLGSPTQRWKDLYLSGSTIYLGAAGELTTDNSGALSITANLTTTANVNSGNVNTENITATTITLTENITAGNVYANSGTVEAANLTGTLTTASQNNITSVGRLASLTVGNSTVTSTFGNGTIISNSISVAGNIILTSTTPISIGGSVGTNGQVLSTTGTGVQWITLSPSSIFNGNSNVSVTANSNVTVSVNGTSNVAVVTSTGVNVAGYVNATSLKLPGGNLGQPLVSDGAGGVIFGNGKAYATSLVNNVIAGSALVFDVDYANATYPAGVFTLRQLGPVTFSMTDTWSSGGTSKNAYLNGVTSTVNTRDISINISLANATFAVDPSTDTIIIGTTVISGANLTSLGIATNAGGTYTIPSSLFASGAQTVNSPIAVSASLTTSRGQFNTSGNSLTNNQYSPFNITFSSSWASSSVPFWNSMQAFNWNSTVTGTVNSGNLIYSLTDGSVFVGNLSTVGGRSGASPSIDSSISYTISTTDYVGIGTNVTSGTSTISTSTILSPATKYYPLFYKITGANANPNFTTGDSYLTKAYTVGDGANTSVTSSNYLWLAVPGSTTIHTFQHTDQGFTVVDTPAVSYLNQTIGGHQYQVYGFTNFNTSLKVSVTT